MSVPTVVYLCYGADEVYDQATYSILTLNHVARDVLSRIRIVVYCDRPQAFDALTVQTVFVTEATLHGWLSGRDYIHRRKTCAIIDALERFGGQVLFVDTDTWFRRSPERLFARVGPGRACFHLCEGFVRSTGTPPDEALVRQIDPGEYRLPGGELVTIARTTRMWNTGVVGVHAADLLHVREALALADDIWAGADPAGAYGKKIHHAEQFAMGWTFRHARLSEADDVVYHYWPQAVKKPFTAELPELLAPFRSGFTREGLSELYGHRPYQHDKAARRDRLKMRIRQAALKLNVSLSGVRQSV